MSRGEVKQPFAVRFFDQQFERQVANHDFGLNPFETVALDYVRGAVLDLGCGLGNLALEAARRGCSVTAVDASRTAVRHVRREAKESGLRVRVVAADIDDFQIEDEFDTVACIGVLMFLDAASGRRILHEIRGTVRPGGVAIVNVLIEGTTFTAMFDPERYHLFTVDEVEACFAGWKHLKSQVEEFPAPGGTKKVFITLVTRKPMESHA